jgi:hypothetical protein
MAQPTAFAGEQSVALGDLYGLTSPHVGRVPLLGTCMQMALGVVIRL